MKLLSIRALTALSVLVLATVSASPRLQDPTTRPRDASASRHESDRADATTIAECMVSCEVGSSHAGMLAADGKKELARVHETLSDCGAICAVTAGLVARGSSLAAAQKEACAKACDSCASECEKSDDATLKDCGQSCRRCAAVCRK